MQIKRVPGAKASFEPKSVEVRECLAEDLIKAEVMTGRSSGFSWLAGVISQVATFDGQPQPPEEVQRLRTKDFLALTSELGLEDALQTSPSGSSTSSEKESGGKNA